MISKIIVENFKGFERIELDLDKSVLFIGPNNSGKTTALQAFALWDIGLKNWLIKKGNKNPTQQKSGIAINRKDLINLPVPQSKLLWNDLHVRMQNNTGKQITSNIMINILVEGNTNDKYWQVGLEFDYFNEESLYCRPLRKSNQKNFVRYSIDNSITYPIFAYLPPMSGLTINEFQKQPGEINYLIGQGQTAQVLRNLCYNLFTNKTEKWYKLKKHVKELFGIDILEPTCNNITNELELQYDDKSKIRLDISCAGRGVQQVLLLLSYIYFNPGSILLLDEPDAHLEVLKQREIYNLLLDIALENKSQIIAASHSEVLLNEAAQSSQVIAFLGKPHVINNKSQVAKSLTTIGWENYYQAEQKGWILYLENNTDLKILQAFAQKLDHPALVYLRNPFVKYVETNIPQKARNHFYAIKEAKDNLNGIAVFDHLEKQLNSEGVLVERMWAQNEIENYITFLEPLREFIKSQFTIQTDSSQLDFMNKINIDRPLQVLDETIKEISSALKILGEDNGDLWGSKIKASEKVLDKIFKNFSQKMNIPLILRKSDYYLLVKFLPLELIDKEIIQILDIINEVAIKSQS
ncbi:MAG: AAA family ATPase [Candidatus Stygibacter australis]|nr:AAA family ATPase [Candidatus Stygibacter australis]MDP8322783.1 AAA family ATPase [Candidatus Stygibacter australis]